MSASVTGRLLLDKRQPGWFNMAADQWLADRTAETGQLCFRLYQWERTTVSLGCHQAEDVVNRGECEKLGWDIVRRATGGRALLHDIDLSYSITVPHTGDRYGELKRLYQMVSELFQAALVTLGIDAIIANAANARVGGTVRAGTRLCLDTHTRGELSVGGRKIVAAAQHLFEHSILQHGSIALSGDTGAIARIYRETGDDPEQNAGRLRRSSVTLEEAAGRAVSLEELVPAIIKALEERFDLPFHTRIWEPDDVVGIQQLRPRFEILTNKD